MKRELSSSDCLRIYSEARKYLLTFNDVNEPLIDKYLDKWQENVPKSKEDLLKGMLNSVKNRAYMSNTIGDVENLRQCLCDFKPDQIIAEFKNESNNVFNKIKTECKPEAKKGYCWETFCKAVISASNFLLRFSDLKAFTKFVDLFYLNEDTRVALPLLLDREIKGMGFALACDFLKENGYPKYVKPDGHIKKIFKGIELSDFDADDYEVFKDVIRFSEKINEIPYRVDKMFWLVGSGDFYDDDIPKISTKRDKFIENINRSLS